MRQLWVGEERKPCSDFVAISETEMHVYVDICPILWRILIPVKLTATLISSAYFEM